MADIFLSYASADRERLRSLVEVLERLGYEVWWDRKLETGSAFDKEIELEVEAARCVVVVWSQHSVSSTWVRAEAMEALERDVLVPMQIDEIKLPLVFRSLQTPQLTGWPTTRSADALNQVLQAVEQTINGKTDRAKAPVEAHDLQATKSIAVLPFRSLSPDPNDAFFAEGLADEILTALSHIPDLLVASRTSSFLFKEGVGGDSKSIGAQLNVNYLLEGSVRKAGNRLRVAVQLTQAIDGYTLWSKVYNDTLDDIFAVQDQIAARVASALKSTLWETTLEHQARNRTVDTQAYREYLLAMHYDRNMHQGGAEELEKVRQHAERAVALDPNFVPAWILLADVYLNRMGYRMPLQEAHGLARHALTHAVDLDPDNPAVILQLAELTRGDHQYTEALALYKKVKQIDPESPQVDYATLLLTVGDLDPALAEFERCIDKDPENFSLWYYYAAALLSRGNVAQALTNFHKSLAIAGDGFLADGVRATLAGITFLYEDADQGLELLKPCLGYNPNRIDFEKGLIAGMQGLMGDKAAATLVATELETRATHEHIDPQALFWVYYGLDEPAAERLFYWLERMIDEDAFPSMYFLKTWPQLAELRKDERYQGLLQKAGIASVAS
jgi:adenylate cyclase